jgi:hypothetical protein
MRWVAPPLVTLAFGLCAAGAAAQEPPAREPAEAQPDPEAAESGEETEPEEEADAPPAKRTPLPGDVIDEDEPEPPLIPPAHDTIAGHISLGVAALWAVPFGELQDGTSQTRLIGSGPGFGVDLGIGISRTVALGAWGQLLRFGDGDECSFGDGNDCTSGNSLGVGAFVRYHLVQGTRFDPWMSAGIGYRRTSIQDFPGGDLDFSGVEWLRLQVGGDWYPVKVLGIGPLIELDMGIYSDRSGGGAQGAPALEQAMHWQFIAGARLSLDIPGK